MRCSEAFPEVHIDFPKSSRRHSCGREGQPRTAYSLRHTQICLRLMEGADIYQIAKNCPTCRDDREIVRGAHQDFARRCCHLSAAAAS